MDAHSLDVLEFDRVRRLLAEHAATGLGRELAGGLQPSPSAERVERRLEELRQFARMVAARDWPPFGGLSDVRPMIRRAIPPAKLEPDDLAVLCDAVRGVVALRHYLADLPPDLPAVAALGARLDDFSPIVARIEEVVDRRGKVRDDATPRLRRVRARIEELRSDLRNTFERLLRQSHVLKLLQYPSATFHGSRMVLPLRSDHRGRITGIIHRSSDSGQTLFIEPTEAVELNNAIIRLTQEESEEVGRVLWELTHLVHLNRAALLATFDAVAVIDLVIAKLKMARRFDMTIPSLSAARVLRLSGARHPVLMSIAAADAAAGREPRPVVPIDVRLGEDFDILIITGPNTGGKTVALKTVGLMALMTQAGLPIPAAEGATLPLFDDVLVDIGDEQSLQQSLSTFSAHLSRILDLLRRGTRDTLVLLDELGAGTDPDDGAALGRAIIDHLLECGGLTMITTHLGALKAVGYEHPRVDNACVEFDYRTFQPTYKLTIGEPGNSSALIIAARLGMPTDMISVAQRYLNERDRTLARAIAGTIESRRAAEEARRAAEEAQRAFEQQAAAARAEQERLAVEQERFRRWVERINALRPGEAVRVKRFDRTGRVVQVQLHRQQVTVAVGALEIQVPLTEIELEPS